MHIRAPIDQVFSALTDPRRAAEWNPAVTSMEDVPTGPATQGTQWRQTMMVGGRPVRVTCTISTLEPPTHGVLTVSGDQQGQITTDCSQQDGGTRVVQTLDFVPPGGLFGQMAGGFISNALRREMVRTMDRQRMTLEAEFARQGQS
jgi:uncharacterized protein YndB with AHSA1/START domain